MEESRENGEGRMACLGRDLYDSSDRIKPSMGPDDAQDDGTSLDAMVFDSSLSFLGNMDGLSESVMLLLDSNPTTSPEPEQLTISSPSTGTSDATSGDADDDGGGDIQQRELPAKASESPVSVKPATTSRERQKEELVYLRKHVAKLASQLAELESKGVRTSAEPSVWEKIAKRQNEAKLEAETENTKLRELLAGQLKVARSLEKLLKRRSLIACTNQFSQRKRLLTTREMDVNAVREEIRSRIFTQLDDVVAVMDECGLAQIFTDMEDTQATTSVTTDNAICMELVGVKVLPFPVEQVAEAVWQVTSSSRIELSNGYFDACRRSETISDVRFTVEIQLRRAKALLDVVGLCARRVESDRAKIVFESAGTTQGTLFADHPIHCRESGFLLIEKNAATNDNTSPSTVVKVCVRLWPEGFQSRGDQSLPVDKNRDFAPFIDLVIGSYNQNVKMVMQLVENTLLEQSQRPRTDSP